jgi:hypothetical protein
MEYLKISLYVCCYLAAFLAVAVLIAELYRYIKSIPWLLIKVKWWIQSLFSRKVKTHSDPTGLQFTGILTTLDISTEKETVLPTTAKQSYNLSAYAKSRRRNAKGQFMKGC